MFANECVSQQTTFTKQNLLTRLQNSFRKLLSNVKSFFITHHMRILLQATAPKKYRSLMQSSDLPVQLNQAKYEFNGGTGFIQKPWVMMREGGGAGIFNPFTQSKLEDVVPARLSIKVRMSLKLLLYAVELRTCSECLIPPTRVKQSAQTQV